MSYVTHDELGAAIAAVTEDIRDTEQRLREEFTNAVRFEADRTEKHLDAQDETLKWINRWALGALVAFITSLLGGLIYALIALHA